MKRALDEGGASATAKKPVFLTKAQREQVALQRREEETAEQRKRLEEQRKHFSSTAERTFEQGGRHHQREKDREHERDRDRELEKERRDRDREREEEAKIREKARLEKQSEREREKELEAIKEQYLGTKKPKKRVIKPSEKFRFSFDWENTEDTSRDMNSLYQNPHDAQLLFGRGFRAGVDRREQKKLAAKNEKDLRAQIRTKEGVEEKPEEAAAQKKREEAANVYDTFDMRVDRHWSEKKLEEMTERDWRIFREDFNISYKGSRIPRPMRNWEEGSLTSELLKAVYKAGYKKPSPIQMAAIPLGLQQRDVIGIAETGSGKTAAFVLPMLTYISRLPPMTEENEAEGPYAVVMAPTRELAQQIEEETIKFAHYLDIRVVSIVGGQSIEEQGFKLRQGCEIVIATPGRLLDCLERRYAVLNQCNYVVLDEADRMIDMGFEPQVVGVLDAMPSSNLKPENEDEDVAHVINFDMPSNIEMYTHRIGRTGRAGKTGVATTFLTHHDSDVFYDLKQMLIQSNSPVPPELARHEASKFKPGTIPDRPPRRNDTVFAH